MRYHYTKGKYFYINNPDGYVVRCQQNDRGYFHSGELLKFGEKIPFEAEMQDNTSSEFWELASYLKRHGLWID